MPNGPWLVALAEVACRIFEGQNLTLTGIPLDDPRANQIWSGRTLPGRPTCASKPWRASIPIPRHMSAATPGALPRAQPPGASGRSSLHMAVFRLRPVCVRGAVSAPAAPERSVRRPRVREIVTDDQVAR